MKPKFFELARLLSLKSAYHHKLGAVVVKKNKPIGVGFNKPHKTHPLSNNNFRTIHAELDAMLSASMEDLDGADIYVYRQLKSGQLAAAKPCVHCEALLRHVGIKNVYYTTTEGIKHMHLKEVQA